MADGMLFTRPHAGPAMGLAATGLGLLGWLHLRAPVPFHYGGICGHGPAEPHCLGCYVAAAMIVGGLACALDPRSRAAKALGALARAT